MAGPEQVGGSVFPGRAEAGVVIRPHQQDAGQEGKTQGRGLPQTRPEGEPKEVVEGAQSGQQSRAMQDIGDSSRNSEAGCQAGGGEPTRGPMLKVVEEKQPSCQEQQGRKGDALVVDRCVPGQ